MANHEYPLLPCQTGLWIPALSDSRTQLVSLPSHSMAGSQGAVLHPSLFPQQGSGVAAVAGLGVWHHQGLTLSEWNYFFKSKHCKAVEPRVFHSWPCTGLGSLALGSCLERTDPCSLVACSAQCCTGLAVGCSSRGPLCGAMQCQQGWHRFMSCFLLKLYHFYLHQLMETLTSCLVTRSRLPPGTSSCSVLRTTALSHSRPLQMSALMGQGTLEGWGCTHFWGRDHRTEIKW